MKRNILAVENEIVHQILFCELCFYICDLVEIIPGRGSDFLPYYYNLNFTKGILSLHGLLLSREKSEMSVKNYIIEYKRDFPKIDTKDFKEKINRISTLLKKSFPMPLRHKIAAHIDENFEHTDFTSAYIMPTLIPEYKRIVAQLKDVFFDFCNHAKNDDPFHKVKKQSDLIIQSIK